MRLDVRHINTRQVPDHLLSRLSCQVDDESRDGDGDEGRKRDAKELHALLVDGPHEQRQNGERAYDRDVIEDQVQMSSVHGTPCAARPTTACRSSSWKALLEPR